MGLLDALSAGIGAAAPAGAALAQGQAQATQSNTGFLEKLAAMQQAKQKADMDRQMAQAQISHLGAQTKSLLNPPVKPKEAYTVPGVGLVERDENGNYAVKVAARDPKDPTPHFAAVTITGPDGKSMIGRFNAQTGQIEDTGFGKPAAAGKAGGGMGGALANRQKDYIGLMDQGIGDMESLSSKIDPYLITAAIKSPMLANPLLGDNEQQYLASARNFLAGVLHEESGARLSDSQLAFGVQRYFPIGGDSPKSIATKLANAKATLAERKRNANYVPPGAPLSPQAQAEISTSASTAPSDATSNMLRPGTRGTVPKGLFQSPTADQPTGKPHDPKFGIFGNP